MTWLKQLSAGIQMTNVVGQFMIDLTIRIGIADMT